MDDLVRDGNHIIAVMEFAKIIRPEIVQIADNEPVQEEPIVAEPEDEEISYLSSTSNPTPAKERTRQERKLTKIKERLKTKKLQKQMWINKTKAHSPKGTLRLIAAANMAPMEYPDLSTFLDVAGFAVFSSTTFQRQ
uniref:Uncharacterized protein n=1 Tax=Ditylenchus dipsaci TaxID=166011 RepID=A0A915EMY3_9BILA